MTACLLFGAMAGSAAAGPYGTAGLEYATADFSPDRPFSASVDDEGPAYGVNLGYRFPDLLALEVGASRFGELHGRAAPCAAGEACSLVVQPSAYEDELSQAGVAIGWHSRSGQD